MRVASIAALRTSLGWPSSRGSRDAITSRRPPRSARSSDGSWTGELRARPTPPSPTASSGARRPPSGSKHSPTTSSPDDGPADGAPVRPLSRDLHHRYCRRSGSAAEMVALWTVSARVLRRVSAPGPVVGSAARGTATVSEQGVFRDVRRKRGSRRRDQVLQPIRARRWTRPPLGRTRLAVRHGHAARPLLMVHSRDRDRLGMERYEAQRDAMRDAASPAARRDRRRSRGRSWWAQLWRR